MKGLTEFLDNHLGEEFSVVNLQYSRKKIYALRIESPSSEQVFEFTHATGKNVADYVQGYIDALGSRNYLIKFDPKEVLLKTEKIMSGADFYLDNVNSETAVALLNKCMEDDKKFEELIRRAEAKVKSKKSR